VADKPEALRLAERIEKCDRCGGTKAVAAELRRLHEAHDWQYKMAGDRLRRIEKLEAAHAELLEALKLALSAHGVMLMSDPPQEAWKAYGVEQKARAAIAKAEGQK
jgi:hypothetical protein